MVIQRIQTLWLALSLGLTVAVALRPFAWLGTQPVYVGSYPVLAVLAWLIVALLFIAVFTYRNLRLQKTITMTALLLMIGLAVTGFIYLARLMPEATPEWGGGVLLLTLAAIFDALAYRGMRRDQRRLRSSDRLWS